MITAGWLVIVQNTLLCEGVIMEMLSKVFRPQTLKSTLLLSKITNKEEKKRKSTYKNYFERGYGIIP